MLNERRDSGPDADWLLWGMDGVQKWKKCCSLCCKCFGDNNTDERDFYCRSSPHVVVQQLNSAIVPLLFIILMCMCVCWLSLLLVFRLRIRRASQYCADLPDDLWSRRGELRLLRWGLSTPFYTCVTIARVEINFSIVGLWLVRQIARVYFVRVHSPREPTSEWVWNPQILLFILNSHHFDPICIYAFI